MNSTIEDLRRRFPAAPVTTGDVVGAVGGMVRSRHGIDIERVWRSHPTARTSEPDNRPDRDDDADTIWHECRHAIVVTALMGRVVALRHKPADRPIADGTCTFTYPEGADTWTKAVIAASGNRGDRGQLEAKGIYLTDWDWGQAELEAWAIVERNHSALCALVRAFKQRDLDEQDIDDILCYRFVR